MACRAFGCKQEAKFENGIGVRVCSARCASKLAPDAHLIMAEHHHTLDHPSDPSLIHIHKTSPMIGIYRKEPTLILRNGKTSLDQCVSAERPDYFEVNKKVAMALKTALVGISKEEIEQQLEEARREAQEVARKRQELQKQLDELKEEERKRKMGDAEAKKSAKEAEKERKAEERRRQKEETRKRRNEKARKYRQEAKEKEAAKKAAAAGEEGARKKATGKQLDELNDDVLLVMIAKLDEQSLRALSLVNRRFSNLTLPKIFEKSSPEGKMRYIYLSIVNNKWDNVTFAFSKYNPEKFGFEIRDFFRKLFMWTSPWEKASEFAFNYEEGSDLDVWDEEEKTTSDQVEKALDIFIRVAFYNEDTPGEMQLMSTPKDLRYFVRNVMFNLTVFHHLNMLNRFFNDPIWSQTIVIDHSIAKHEMMIYAAYAGFKEFVAQMVADPTVRLTYKNSSVFGVAIGEPYRSPYDDYEYFLTSETSDGPTDIRKELNQVVEVLFQSGREFEKISPSQDVGRAPLFESWNAWWDTEGDVPYVLKKGLLGGPVTSKKNTALALAVYNNRTEIINRILPLHQSSRLTNDAELARMLVYYYPVVAEDYPLPTRHLELFERVMRQSNYTLVPTGMAPKIIYTASLYLFPTSKRTVGLDTKDREAVLRRLANILILDTRLTKAQKDEIATSLEASVYGGGNDDWKDKIENGDLDDDADYSEPWISYWQQVDQASPMQM